MYRCLIGSSRVPSVLSIISSLSVQQRYNSVLPPALKADHTLLSNIYKSSSCQKKNYKVVYVRVRSYRWLRYRGTENLSFVTSEMVKDYEVTAVRTRGSCHSNTTVIQCSRQAAEYNGKLTVSRKFDTLIQKTSQGPLPPTRWPFFGAFSPPWDVVMYPYARWLQ